MEGRSYNIRVYVITSVSIGLITDLMVLTMPMWMIYDLRMPQLRKLVLVLFLSLGLAVMAVQIVRLHYLVRLFVYFGNPRYSVQDAYSAIKCKLSIIGSCTSTIKWIWSRCIPFFRRSLPPRVTSRPDVFESPAE